MGRCSVLPCLQGILCTAPLQNRAVASGTPVQRSWFLGLSW